MVEYRRLRAEDVERAVALHRCAGALIPGYDPTEAPAEALTADYARLVDGGGVEGAFDGERLVGTIAQDQGWIEHLYVAPDRHGEGIGRALIERAQATTDALRLVTYQSNVRARRIYEQAGFVAEAYGHDPDHPALAPNVTYCWPTLAEETAP